MSSIQEVLDRYADGTPYVELSSAFLSVERWTGDDPLCLLAEAAASTTGQNYFTGVTPTVERFRDTFVETGRLTSFDDLTALEVDDEDFVETMGAKRKRRVFLEAAQVFSSRPEDDDFEAMQSWAAEADVYRYESDPIGSISGVGPASFQYLRMLSGIDTAKPDPQVTQFIETLSSEIDSSVLDASEPLRAVASCEWLSIVTEYRMLEIDQLAWWTGVGESDREAAMASL